MEDFEAPSFSLGLDFDLLDSDPQIATEDNKPPSVSNQTPAAETILEDEDEGFETITVVDSENENQGGSSPKLKRLRRGIGSTVTGSGSSVSVKRSTVVVDDDDDDDDDEDIDDFSSQEDEHLSSTHRNSVSSNSTKLSLRHGVLTKQPGKRKQNVLNDPESVITSCNKQPFPKLTVSPLRRFQLLDSDSDFDDPFISISEGATNNKTCNGPESYNQQRKLNEAANTTTKKDLWEDFPFEKNVRISTPALDEVCEEYFSSLKDKSKSQTNIRKTDPNIHVIDLDDPRPPAHQYFFHTDPRVQDLVRTRLPYFFPLNAANRDSQQPSTSNIDYMGQFSHGEKPKQAARTNKVEPSSSKNSRKSKTQETSQGFKNPRLSTKKEIPKDAGKRRVQADVQAAGAGAGVGHWFTNQEGKKVYVSNNGQELTGRAAYILYKKERGGGFKNKKAKKSSTKKK